MAEPQKEEKGEKDEVGRRAGLDDSVGSEASSSLSKASSLPETLKMKQAATGGELTSERRRPECCLGKRWWSPSFGLFPFFEFGIEKGGDLARSPPLSSLPGRRIVFASHRDTTAGRA